MGSLYSNFAVSFETDVISFQSDVTEFSQQRRNFFSLRVAYQD